MSTCEARAADRIGSAGMGAFIGFFVAPAFVVATLAMALTEGIPYEAGGLILLISTLGGAAVGWAVGAVADSLDVAPRARTRALARAALVLVGASIGPALLSPNPWVGALIGGLVGLILGDIAAKVLTRPGPDSPVETPEPSLWDLDLDS